MVHTAWRVKGPETVKPDVQLPAGWLCSLGKPEQKNIELTFFQALVESLYQSYAVGIFVTIPPPLQIKKLRYRGVW